MVTQTLQSQERPERPETKKTGRKNYKNLKLATQKKTDESLSKTDRYAEVNLAQDTAVYQNLESKTNTRTGFYQQVTGEMSQREIVPEHGSIQTPGGSQLLESGKVIPGPNHQTNPDMF